MRPDVSSRWARQAHGLTYFRPPQASVVSRAFSAARRLKVAGEGACLLYTSYALSITHQNIDIPHNEYNQSVCRMSEDELLEELE